jgi:diacylglycerol kinase (ATP)
MTPFRRRSGPATVILNLRSSHARRELDRVRSLLAVRGINVADFWTVNGTAELKRRLKQAARKRAETVIVGGGDGTMTQAANVLARTSTVLGVLPLGTGNSFALTLGVGDSLENAVDTSAAGRVACVDLGLVNGHYFANFATIGFAAEVAQSADHNLKALVGPIAYFVAALLPLLLHKGFRARVRAKKRRLALDTQQIIVVNGRFFGNRAISDDATDTDGKLRFYATGGTSRLEILRTYVAFALGIHRYLPEAHAFADKRIKVRTKPRQPLSIDGDALGKTPAHFSVARGALQVFVPSSFGDGRR